MVRFILLSVLLTILVRFVARVIREAVCAYRGVPNESPRRRPAPAPGVQMVRDPVCGTFVVPGRAPTLNCGGERVHFCSSACLDRYRADHQVATASQRRTA